MKFHGGYQLKRVEDCNTEFNDCVLIQGLSWIRIIGMEHSIMQSQTVCGGCSR